MRPARPLRAVGELRRGHRGARRGPARPRRRSRLRGGGAELRLGRVARAKATVAGIRARRRPVVEIAPGDIPSRVRATDVLALDSDAVDAVAIARELGLPRRRAGAAWAALGALAAVVRIRDDGHRSSVIVDESGSGSPLGRWARAVGFAPVELELTGQRAAVAVLDIDTASLDVITRLHPGGCTASDVDVAIGQASWALRSGGLLILTLPIGDGFDFALPADVRASSAPGPRAAPCR